MRGLILLATLALAACATTMSARECRDADWDELGHRDGVRGEPATRLDERRTACAGEGTVNAEAWRRGYERGIGEFCTPAGGYNAGRADVGEESLCAGRPNEEAFRAAYKHGGQVHVLLREVRELYRKFRYEAEQRTDKGLGLRDTEFVRSLERREAWLRQRDDEFSERYGVERLSDDDLDPDRVR
jgi:hypothetical protein